ncbi:toxin-antitoxin system YwqK family antitoxin [Flavobacterium hercynium]|uniref:MORN repeat protein n=1 Tax=Flavobacterium hercynium TaxID=387094 RepID=A0A226H4A5_9FLAO|nr:hypothetical protein [Flavobacterium hercynium]OXA88698.1 hypothetical protein B0A66_14935 [Flavobacterium hercynium]SMP34442.1 hypothetical protein SAMN06265346_11818 [Flavobacterium hercynium]
MKKSIKFLLLFLIITCGAIIIYVFSIKKEEQLHDFRYYDPKTHLLSVSQFVIRNNDSIFQGKFTTYNEKGTKIAEANFIEGHVEGKCINYFENGKIESIQYKRKGDIKEESFWYYPNGIVEKYALYNPLGGLIFTAKYDQNGEIESYKGSPQIEVYQYKFANKKKFNIKNDQYLKVGDILKHTYVLGNIPYTKRSLKIENLAIPNNKVKRTITKNSTVEINVEEVLVKKGVNTIRTIVEYKFNDKTTPTLTDTISFNVTVN